jgi:hypothetical protein
MTIFNSFQGGNCKTDLYSMYNILMIMTMTLMTKYAGTKVHGILGDTR